MNRRNIGIIQNRNSESFRGNTEFADRHTGINGTELSALIHHINHTSVIVCNTDYITAYINHRILHLEGFIPDNITLFIDAFHTVIGIYQDTVSETHYLGSHGNHGIGTLYNINGIILFIQVTEIEKSRCQKKNHNHNSHTNQDFGSVP